MDKDTPKPGFFHFLGLKKITAISKVEKENRMNGKWSEAELSDI
jgi:hypothetical protein